MSRDATYSNKNYILESLATRPKHQKLSAR